MAATVLTRIEFTVLEVRDGLEAFEIFNQHRNKHPLGNLRFDHAVHGRLGDTIRPVKPSARHAGSPAIGYNESQVMAGDHPDRPDAFLHKPFSTKNPAAVVRQVLAQE